MAKPYKGKMKKFGNILWGLVLVIIGIIFALNALGITDINIFFRGWWTLIIIIPSLIGLFKNESKMWSIIWLVIGIVLLLCAQNILSFTMVGKLIFPFILVMIGLSIIFKGTINKNVSEKIEKEYKNSYKVKVISDGKYKNTFLYLNLDKKINDFNYGDEVQLTGEFNKATGKRNYGGFDYNKYLKTIKIHGTVKVSKIKKINS